MSDPFELLRHHVRGQADEMVPGTSTDELVAHITLEYDRPVLTPPAATRPRRWVWVALAASVCVGAGVGTVGTASLVSNTPVSAPEAGVVCRSAADPQSSAIVVDPGEDPVGRCADLWRQGALPDVEAGSPPSDPSLVACTGDGGALEVFPGSGPDVCTSMGLGVADVQATLADPRRELATRIQEVNGACLGSVEAAQRVRVILDDVGFDDWTVVTRPGKTRCSVVAIGMGEDHTLYVTPLPSS